ncbi:MAG TPA: MFS transporter [Brevundimonas sp.]
MTDTDVNGSAARLATRLAFVAAGIAMASWAPLVPSAKARVGLDEAGLGMLLLCLGIGSVAAMPVTGMLAARFGSRPMILLGGIGLGLTMPALALASTPGALAAALLVFGASLGTLDVAMNAHAVEVEAASERLLMSGFHALFSVGGIIGAGAITVALAHGVSPLAATIGSALITLVCVAVAAPGLLRTTGESGGAVFALPKGIVLLIAVLVAATFLAEGALLDWSALLITQTGATTPGFSGIGYVLFSAAMTFGRLTGDATVGRLGPRLVLQAGGVVAVAGFSVLLLSPVPWIALSGFVLIGLGAANIVPILFSAAGRQKTMPAPLAIAAVTTTGYAGLLAGPAALGFIAHASSLQLAFWLLAVLVALVPLTAGLIALKTVAD